MNMSWGVRPALPLRGGSDPGGYVRGFMSANRLAPNRVGVDTRHCRKQGINKGSETPLRQRERERESGSWKLLNVSCILVTRRLHVRGFEDPRRHF